MFEGCRAFNQPLGGWDMSRVRNAGDMFKGARRFSQDLSAWRLPEGCECEGMFEGTAMRVGQMPGEVGMEF
ncbi:MAG: DUF285 domain-containing protein, partial [Succinivibrionaceae bacterium]|nr:DUF285 domain-containing protein [Succinivibrionaceae bacterium]